MDFDDELISDKDRKKYKEKVDAINNLIVDLHKDIKKNYLMEGALWLVEDAQDDMDDMLGFISIN